MYGTDGFLGSTLTSLVKSVKSERRPIPEDNPLWQAQTLFSNLIISSLDGYRDMRDKWQEQWFHAVYGSPFLQSLVGLNGSEPDPRLKPAIDAAHRILVDKRIAELKANVALGGPLEAAVRALVYVRMPEGAVDERSLAVLRRTRRGTGKEISLQAFKQVVREQFFTLLLDQRGAIDAIPAMLAKDTALASEMKSQLHAVLKAVGLDSTVGQSRLAEIETLFDAALSAKPLSASGKPRQVIALSASLTEQPNTAIEGSTS
jgi:hypothetical protein